MLQGNRQNQQQPRDGAQHWRSASNATAAWLVLLAAIVVQAIAFDPDLNFYDEGIILVGAERVWRGELPYKDFWTMYGPAQFYLTSWLFSVFGPADLAVRAIGIAAKAAIASLAFLAVARQAPRSWALAASSIVLVLLIAVRNDAFPVFPALAFALAAMLLVDRGGSRRGTGNVFLAGVCTGCVTAFRHDLGAYSALGIGLGIALAQQVRDGQAAPARSGAARQLLVFALGVLAVVAPVTVWLLQVVPLADLNESLIHSPSAIYPAFRALPFPGPAEFPRTGRDIENIGLFVVYLPFLVVAWAAAIEFMRLRGGPPSTTQRRDQGALVPVLVITCLLFTVKGLVRVSAVHMVQALVLAVVLLAICSARFDWRLPGSRLLLAPVVLVAGFLLAQPLVVGLRHVARGMEHMAGAKDSFIRQCIDPPLPRLRCVNSDPDYLLAARFVMEHSNSGDPIYVGTGRHDKLFISGLAFYFMAERRPATKWYELHPGIQTREDVQRQMIRQMQETPPKLVVLDSRWDDMQEPNDSRRPSGARLLDDHLRAGFAEVQRYGSVRILAPR